MGSVNGIPVHAASCGYCGQPFKRNGNQLFAWRSTAGKLYCSEFCAGDEEEANIQNTLGGSDRPYTDL
jgi:hypothetical protein